MRAALLTSLFTLFLLLCGAEAEARKLFIREVRVAPSCVSVSHEALLVLIAQQVPRDVLARRGLQYEDLPSYLDLANWTPERFDVRQSTNITRRLHQLDMQYMLWLEFSCLPEASHARYMLTGRLTDLDAMDRILACPARQAGSRAGRRVCNVGGQVSDAVSFTSVEVPTFDAFPAALRELLARLLHVPEISLAANHTVFDSSEDVDLPFLLRRNDGTEPGYAGTPALARGYRMRQDVVQLPSELYAEVCHAPALRWDQIACRGGFTNARCDAADRVNYEVRSLIHREVPARALGTLPTNELGGDRIVFRAPPYEANYLMRAEAIADEQGGEVHSTPIFACFRVRARPWRLGLVSRLGIGLFSVSADDSYPAAALGPPLFGVDAVLGRFLLSSGRGFFPQSTVDVLLGMSRLSGIYPCPSGDTHDCRVPPSTTSRPIGPIRASTSWTAELRVGLRVELFRVWRIAPIFVGELGFGAEYLASDVNAFRNDGWGAVYMTGVGGGLQFTMGRPNEFSSQMWLGVTWQVRMRLGSRAVWVQLPGNHAWADAAGVADGIQTLWFTLGVAFAPPRANE